MSEYITVISSVLSSVGVSAAMAGWLAKQLAGHRLKKDLEDYKAELKRDSEEHNNHLKKQLQEYQARLDLQRDEQQASLRRQVETLLGNEAADRQYALEARKRLYTAVGPLRFQLLLACRQAEHRISGHGIHPYSLDPRHYYGRNTLYRILKPLAISELIERQIAYTDFAVDPSAIRLLRFRKSAWQAWTGDVVVLDHPSVNWEHQEQHVVSDRLAAVSEMLIKELQPGSERVLTYREFETLLEKPGFLDTLEPFPELFEKFSATTKPILWVRFVCFGYICNELIAAEGKQLGFEKGAFPVRELLQKSTDHHLGLFVDRYEKAVRDVSETKL